MRDRLEFMGFLDQQALMYRGLLEDMFGQCDQRFVFGKIKKSIRKDDQPRTQYPNGFHFKGGCVVDIHISEEPWQCCHRDRGTWQLAHESVHLLDPVERGASTFLEEGLATWFQNEPKFHTNVMQVYIVMQEYIERSRSIKDSPDYYDEAEELVCRCMPQLISVVKKIRSLGVRIQDIKAGELAPYLPNVGRETIELLCRKFPS